VPVVRELAHFSRELDVAVSGQGLQALVDVAKGLVRLAFRLVIFVVLK
jgi:hypothetical protein